MLNPLKTNLLLFKSALAFLRSIFVTTVTLLFISIIAVASDTKTPIVLISDIDDTIKVSHVRDKLDAFINMFHTGNVFRGMPELYHLIQSHQPTMPIYYLTNAPEFLMNGFHTEFLDKNEFPMGRLLLRKKLSDKKHKVNRIHEIIKELKPEAILLFGDNGEHDSEVYEQIRKQYPKIKFHTYIHQLYGENTPDKYGNFLKTGQRGFVTPIEVVIDLANENLISEVNAKRFIDQLGPDIIMHAEKEHLEHLKRGVLSYPSWKNSTDFKWDTRYDQFLGDRTVLMKFYKDRIKVSCSKVLSW